MANVRTNRRIPPRSGAPLGSVIRAPPSTRKNIRIGITSAAAKLPTLRSPRPCHVMPIEMIVRGMPATVSG